MDERPQPNVFQLLFFEFFCAALPTVLLFVCTFYAQPTFDFERIVGYSAVMLIGFGVFLSALAALMVARGINMDWWGIWSIVLFSFFFGGSLFGVYSDAIAEGGDPTYFKVWFVLQLIFTMAALAYCAATKSSLLTQEHANRNLIRSEIETLQRQLLEKTNDNGPKSD